MPRAEAEVLASTDRTHAERADWQCTSCGAVGTFASDSSDEWRQFANDLLFDQFAASVQRAGYEVEAYSQQCDHGDHEHCSGKNRLSIPNFERCLCNCHPAVESPTGTAARSTLQSSGIRGGSVELAASGWAMSISLEGRIASRMSAPYHVQLELDQKAAPVEVPSIVVVQGRVVRLFRSDSRLKSGDRLGFKIWVCQPGDEPTGPAFVYYKEFMSASYVEVYLHGNPPNCELAAYEFALISAPTDQPSMTIAQLQELPLSSMPTHGQSVPRKRSWWGRTFGREQ